MRGHPLLPLPLALACAGSQTGAVDSSLPVEETCEPATLNLAQDLRQEELPADASIKHTEPGVALADLDNDGDLDALIGWAGGVFGLRNDGSGTLLLDPSIDIDGGANVVRGTALAVADLDQDGDIDAWLGEYPMGDLLLWNDGSGHFTSQRLWEGDPLFSPWSGAFGDADGDGDLDLYISMLVPNLEPEPVLDGSLVAGPNYLYVNQGGGDLVRDDSRVPQEGGLTFQAAWVDLDGDGDLDIYEANDFGFYMAPNRYLRNDGTGHFTQDDSCLCQAEMYAMGVAVGDLQGDGRPDLVVTNLNSPTLFENYDDDGMVDASRARGIYIPPSETNFTSWGTSFLDFDRNGCPDVAVAYGRMAFDVDLGLDGLPEDSVDPLMQANVMLMNDCTPSFTRLEGSDFDAFLDRDRSMAVGDLDGDGRADLVTAGKHFVRVWMAGGGCDNGVTVRLSQPGENVAAIGARVTLTANGRDEVMWMLPATTHSSSALELTFGLGTATTGELSVLWPDGTRTDGVSVSSGDSLTVER